MRLITEVNVEPRRCCRMRSVLVSARVLDVQACRGVSFGVVWSWAPNIIVAETATQTWV